jgi:hypothetical protein
MTETERNRHMEQDCALPVTSQVTAPTRALSKTNGKRGSPEVVLPADYRGIPVVRAWILPKKKN